MLGLIHYFSSTMTLVLSAQISGTFLSRNLKSFDKYLVSFSFSWLCGLRDLSSPTRNCTQAIAVKIQNLNHQGTPSVTTCWIQSTWVFGSKWSCFQWLHSYERKWNKRVTMGGRYYLLRSTYAALPITCNPVYQKPSEQCLVLLSTTAGMALEFS